MMTNLFSSFDPVTSMNLSLNWMSTFLGIIIIPPTFWMIPSRYSSLIKMIHLKLYTEFKTLLGPSSSSSIIFISLFTFILFNNIMGLIPYVYTSSSHIIFTLSLALPMWLSIMIFGWFNHTQHMLAHLVPESSPAILMPILVCIETISNMIRPGSLAVRLTANMIAGHTLLCLLGNSATSATSQMIPIFLVLNIVLLLFETAVSFIQAYVFSILSTLYTSEVT
uniref:ATP synthase subunit a n=1 Tax=Eratyrus mucronatus TaxID=162367 RepID=A0A7D7JEL6_9HEMI|nr:ATP synthase F0 subunit 6 [Eratyrus mucronatus]